MDDQIADERTTSFTRRSWLKLAGIAVIGTSTGVGVTGAQTAESGYGAGGYGDGGYGDPTTESTTPTLTDDTATVQQGEAITIEVLANDSDFDGSMDTYTVLIETAPSSGSATVNTDNTIDYTHDGSDTASDSFVYTVSDANGQTATAATVSMTVESSQQSPYADHELTQIQAEDFDTGGEGVAYHDTDSGNNGGAYRDTAVDIEATNDDGGGYNIGWIESGEWWEYTVDVPAAGEYNIVARVVGWNETSLDFAIDETQVASVTVPNTESWQAWTTVDAGTVDLAAGTQTVRLSANGGDFNFNWFGLEQSDTTAPTAPTSLTADSLTDTTVELSWEGSSDAETGVETYTVFRDGTATETVPAGTTAVTLSDLSPASTYDFHVTATDGMGNESDSSNTVTITTDEPTEMISVTGDGAAAYNDDTTVRYILETTGEIGAGDAGDLEDSDRAGGPTASGEVAVDGSETDTYALTDGTLSDVTTWGGDVTVTVDGSEWTG